ncbi:hypothetical protein ABFY54_28925 [Priestia megaterium]|uniref:hypothetical protein n=1 Tax=Priestia megaterium TaxID=1404 RepID=UPI003D2CD043
MFEYYIITEHVIDRYRQRVDETVENIKKRIKQDLYFKKIKQIVNKGNVRHVFTISSKEFIFVKERGRWLLKTVIKRSRKTNDLAIQQRRKTAVC